MRLEPGLLVRLPCILVPVVKGGFEYRHHRLRHQVPDSGRHRVVQVLPQQVGQRPLARLFQPPNLFGIYDRSLPIPPLRPPTALPFSVGLSASWGMV